MHTESLSPPRAAGQPVISFPLIGHYDVPLTRLFGTLFPAHEVRPAPAMTARTLELGSRHSPDFICSPFKYTLGNYIEALDAGATVLLQTGMGCLFGYYGAVQERILRDLGYEFEFLCFSREQAGPLAVYKALRRLGCPLGPPGILRALKLTVDSLRLMDELEYYMREHIGFETSPGSFESLHRRFLKELGDADGQAALADIRFRYTRAFREVGTAEDGRILRVGLVGELYTLMEPFSNFYLERELARHHMAVSRRMSATYLLFDRSDADSLRTAKPYLRYIIGANGVDSVAQSLDYARRGYDGVIHMKAFGCTPELNAMPALQNISRDRRIPILHLSFDTHTSETGLQTRLEAFHDMIEMRKARHGHTGDAGAGHRLHIDEGRGH